MDADRLTLGGLENIYIIYISPDLNELNLVIWYGASQRSFMLSVFCLDWKSETSFVCDLLYFIIVSINQCIWSICKSLIWSGNEIFKFVGFL